jgi:hypothetical protein
MSSFENFDDYVQYYAEYFGSVDMLYLTGNSESYSKDGQEVGGGTDDDNNDYYNDYYKVCYVWFRFCFGVLN